MKSQSELNWVFVLVAGAIILAFFTGFAFKYKAMQEEKLAIEFVTGLDNSLTSLKTSPYATYTEIKIPKTVEIDCNKTRIDKSEFDTNNLIFSPKILKNKMLIYYKPFKTGFKVADFYFITDENKKYNLISDLSTKDYVENLKNNLPEKLQSKFTSSSSNVKNIEIKNLNNNKINIKSDTFNSQIDLNDELVYGVIFSDDFQCLYQKVKDETKKVSEVYENKLSMLNNPNCNYPSFQPYLNNLKEFKLEYISSIETLNQELSGRNCPTLY